MKIEFIARLPENSAISVGSDLSKLKLNISSEFNDELVKLVKLSDRNLMVAVNDSVRFIANLPENSALVVGFAVSKLKLNITRQYKDRLLELADFDGVDMRFVISLDDGQTEISEVV